MQWRPAPQALIDRFGEVVPQDARVERRKMFGYPCAFAGGNLFAGLFADRMMLRLPDAARAEFLALPGAEGFAPMGRPMREYVVVPPAVLADTARMSEWLERSLAYAQSLPSKAKKPKPPAVRKIAKPLQSKTTRAKSKPATKKSSKGKVAKPKRKVRR